MSPLDFNQINLDIDVPDAKDEVIADLEAQLMISKDARKMERFYWIMTVVMLVACMLLEHVPVMAGIFVLVFALLGIVVSARECGVDWAYQMTEALLHKLCESLPHIGEKKSEKATHTPQD